MVKCEWSFNWSDDDYWDTSCGNAFVIIEGTPEDNGFKYCPYCGKPLVEVGHKEMDDK